MYVHTYLSKEFTEFLLYAFHSNLLSAIFAVANRVIKFDRPINS